jgi:hypothetical protein
MEVRIRIVGLDHLQLAMPPGGVRRPGGSTASFSGWVKSPETESGTVRYLISRV